MPLDIIIRGGRVLDGAGNPWYTADVGIEGNRIAALGRLDGATADRTIDATGLMVAPGFIDTHTHSDLMVFVDPKLEPKIRQGITTDVLCQDGISAAPTRRSHAPAWRKYLAGLDGDPPMEWSWESFDEYLKAIEGVRPGINTAALVPQGNIRQWVLGLENRAPSAAELDRMKVLIDECMEAGAFGMSIGLIYLPCVFSDRTELVEQFKVVGRHHGIMVIHMRNEADYWLEAIDETIDIARRAEVGLLISHFKAVGKQNWDKMPIALEKLEQARASGVDVCFDQYPYTAGSTILSAILPPWAVEGGNAAMLERLQSKAARERIRREFETGLPPEAGGWDNIVRCAGWNGIFISSVGSEANRWCEGKSLAEIGAATGKEPADAAFDLLLHENGAVGMIDFIASEECVRQALSHDLQMVCTDGLLLGSRPHPRSYGSFARMLGKYVREERALSLQQAVRHMTSMPAARLGLRDRGIIRPGMRADITVFNAETVRDTGTYMEPRQFPEGIPYVLVGGQVAVDRGVHTGVRAGEVLRHRA